MNSNMINNNSNITMDTDYIPVEMDTPETNSANLALLHGLD